MGQTIPLSILFTLVAGLIVPLLAMLNLVYLCLSRNIGDYDSQFYNLIYMLKWVLSMYVFALPCVALLSTRYSLKACAVPILFVVAGALLNKGYDPFMSYYSTLRYGIPFRITFSPNASYFQSLFSAVLIPVIVYFLGLWMKRLLKGRVTRALFTLLSLLVFATSLNAVEALLNWLFEKNKYYIGRVFLPEFFDNLFALIIMALITAIILLIFHFKIPTDDPPLPPKAEELSANQNES